MNKRQRKKREKMILDVIFETMAVMELQKAAFMEQLRAAHQKLRRSHE